MNLKKGLFERSKEPFRISYESDKAVQHLSTSLHRLLPTMNIRPIVFVCIGTDRSTGDSLGPLVGTFLQEKNCPNIFVYGTLEDPIHAVNLHEKLQMIQKRHTRPFIIGIDACLGRMKSVGAIQVGNGPVKPGAGVNKELPEVGDIHITGIVNVSGFMEFFVLQNTRLNLVLQMARTITESIYEATTAVKSPSYLTQLKWQELNEQTL
ncbi:sporulation protein [Bacillus coahuilensis p1.1.43]|uniref:Sporulation protein n=1 Tax=Bacillus coahuilensis p1.1.43 TaxID=1150625 RepID=A0A147KCF0_9BACI|nr:spore protease YyaC [Bacillus coahuilensis]KUP09376.1 sporulation protein [Bacillus coahuilensis p1.1.43]